MQTIAMPKISMTKNLSLNITFLLEKLLLFYVTSNIKLY